MQGRRLKCITVSEYYTAKCMINIDYQGNIFITFSYKKLSVNMLRESALGGLKYMNCPQLESAK